MAKPKPEFDKETSLRVSIDLSEFLQEQKICKGETKEDVIRRLIKGGLQ